MERYENKDAINNASSGEAEKSNTIQLERLEEYNKKIISLTESQLEQIKDSLGDLVFSIKAEKPDYIIFLDKSARIFGSPLRKYLKESGMQDLPEFKFYNDEELKKVYLRNQPLDNIINSDFSYLKGKKIFFVDETFSRGKGAAAIKEVSQFLNLEKGEVFYFALTKDPIPQDARDEDWEHWRSLEEHNKIVAELQQDPHFMIYNNPIPELFSRKASRLYIDERNSKTVGRYAVKLRDKKDTFSSTPSAKKYMQPPNGLTREEYEKKIQEMNLKTVRIIKEKIYRTLHELSEKALNGEKI